MYLYTYIYTYIHIYILLTQREFISPRHYAQLKTRFTFSKLDRKRTHGNIVAPVKLLYAENSILNLGK